MNEVSILIISNSLDFTTDYVCFELYKRNASYLRINRDKFTDYNISLDVLNCKMEINFEDQMYHINQDTLKAIYYRAPIYLRDIYKPGISEQEQLFRTQWTAFIRNLTIFDEVIWVNNPESTFKAENKLLQLKVAKKLGMSCPNTIVTNCNKINLVDNSDYIVKSLDTAILRIEENEAFVYSNRIKGEEIKRASLSIAPIVVQEYISPKIDVRVTVIGNQVYSVRILKEGKGVEGDWRLYKNNIKFVPFSLPKRINEACVELVHLLGLSFGGIDLIESDDKYYFIEINPTGEWAWLVNTANLRIYEGICDYLEGKNGCR